MDSNEKKRRNSYACLFRRQGSTISKLHALFGFIFVLVLTALYMMMTMKSTELVQIKSLSENLPANKSLTRNSDLKNVANHIRSIVDTAKTQTYFNSKRGDYGNKADFDGIVRLFRYVKSMKLDNKESVVMLGGTNSGQLSSKILKMCPNITFYGFEIQREFFSKARDRLKEYPNVHMFNQGWSEFSLKNQEIGGKGEAGGLFDPKGQRGWEKQAATVDTIPISEFAIQNHILETLYVVIDTEGHEPKVIRGMHLNETENQKRFPLFQFELGGTWAANDNRHGNDRWSQKDTVQALEDNGYLLFMIGSHDWLLVNPDFFDGRDANPAVVNEGFGTFVQGNLLAMHKDYVPLELGIFILASARVQSDGKIQAEW